VRTDVRLVAAACVLAAASVSAQPVRPGAPAAGLSPLSLQAAAIAKQAAAASVKGDADEAFRLSNEALALDATNREALAVKAGVLVNAGRFPEALDAYDAWQKAAGKDDPPTLALFGRGTLQALVPDADRAIGARALEALARAGVPDARAALGRLRASSDDPAASSAATEALARLGDARAGRELLATASAGTMTRRFSAVQAVGVARPVGASKALVKLLGDPDPMIRSGVLDALASLGDVTVKPAVLKRLADSDRIVRLGAAATLHRLGDRSGEKLLLEALNADLADLRLLAASGFKGSADRTWVAAIRPILADMNGRNRLIAADLLLPVEREAALETIRAALADENPWIRTTAAQMLVADPSADTATLRTMLRDGSPWVRLYAAGRLATPQAPRGRGAGRETGAPPARTPPAASNNPARR